MIQFNLLPAVKLEYVKARRNKRLAILASLLVGGIALVVMVILFISVQKIQKNYSKDLANDIKEQSKTLKGITDLNKILTIQNQLNNLNALHDQKPVTTQLFGYLKQITPKDASVATAKVDFDLYTMEVTGSANSLNTINKYADTLKFTNYFVTYDSANLKESKETKAPCTYKELSFKDDGKITTQICTAFSEVVLKDFSRDEKEATYQLTLKYDPAIFSSARVANLIVPQDKITTRSVTEKPGEEVNDLFKKLNSQSSGGN